MKRQMILWMAMLCMVLGVEARPVACTDWPRDLDSLARWLPQRHYDFFTVRSRADFDRGIEVWKRRSRNGLSDLQMALGLQQWIATFGDLHTNLNFTPLLDRNRLLPLGLKWMADGLYVVTAPVGQEAMLGCRLVELNGTAAEVVADSLGTLFSADNEAVRKTMVPNYLCFVQLLEHFGFVSDGRVTLKLASADGSLQEHELMSGPIDPKRLATFRPSSFPLCYRKCPHPFYPALRGGGQPPLHPVQQVLEQGAGRSQWQQVGSLPPAFVCRAGGQCVRHAPPSACQQAGVGCPLQWGRQFAAGHPSG